MGQRRCGLIQRCFGPSWMYQVYFLHKSTEFHDMRTECQIILIHFVLIIYHKSTWINHSLITLRLLPNRSPIALRSSEALISNCFLASEAANLNPLSKIAFHDIVPSSVNWPSKILLTEDPSGWPFSPNPPKFLLPLRIPSRPPSPNITSQRQNGTK